jgi:predicted RNase H-like HicB family nuclease
MKSDVRPRPTGGLELSFSIIVEPDETGFYAHCPALKGIHVDGKTKKEALDRAVEAAGCYFESMVRRKEAFPIDPDLTVRRAPRRSRVHVHARRYEVQWPSLRTCGTR